MPLSKYGITSTRRARRYRFAVSRSFYRAMLRPLRRATDPARGYPLPALPRLAMGRLESLLDVLESGRHNQRAVWLAITEREASTMHAFTGWCLRAEQKMPPSADAVRRRCCWLTGLD